MDKKLKSSEREAFRLIEEMLELMESRGLVELDIEREGLRIRLKRAFASQSPHVIEDVVGAPEPIPTAHQTAAAPPKDAGHQIVIKSPMVGTFYRAPAPDATPFCEVGQEVDVGQVVCIIEAMKLMNEIKSEVSGRIVDVLVQSGDAVEFGQPLFAVEPRG